MAVATPPLEQRPPKVRTKPGASLFEPSIVRRAVGDSFRKLDPRQMAKNPVMFVVEIGSVVTTVLFFTSAVGVADFTVATITSPMVP